MLSREKEAERNGLSGKNKYLYFSSGKTNEFPMEETGDTVVLLYPWFHFLKFLNAQIHP